jgi:NADH dehydrogenase (ubiquinone) 1 alpha subcomplex subunit 13
MPQDLPPIGGYDPIQYKVRSIQHPVQLQGAIHTVDEGILISYPQRNLPVRGFRPVYYLAAVGAVMTYGFWRVGQGIREWKFVLPSPVPSPRDTNPTRYSELAREKMWSRIYLIPLLQAEEDRDLVRKHLADLAREKALLGKETSAYNGDRFVRPTFAVTPQHVTK